MPIDSVAFCRYPAEITWQWRPDDWGANRFISALKGEAFKGYADIRILGRPIRVNATTAPKASKWFADLVFDYLSNHEELNPPFFFVPIPDSGCALRSDIKPRMLRVANDLATRFGGRSEVCDILRWRAAMQPSHVSGQRNVRQLHGNLMVTASVPRYPVVLLDDINTNGGHIRAAEARINEKGGEVEVAVTAGKTVWEPRDPMWDTFKEELPEYR